MEGVLPSREIAAQSGIIAAAVWGWGTFTNDIVAAEEKLCNFAH